MAAPEPDGRGAAQAMQMALASAGLSAAEIDYINLHGTATSKNDEMEGKAVFKVFGSAVACSSTKTQLGHCLGAAGALELGLCWLMLSELNPARELASHLWDAELDPAIPELNLVAGTNCWQRGLFLSNTFGFGGSNVSIVLGRSQ
jgi:3-oxoacyl-[acyl-carrier-protein] synthase-1